MKNFDGGRTKVAANLHTKWYAFGRDPANKAQINGLGSKKNKSWPAWKHEVSKMLA